MNHATIAAAGVITLGAVAAAQMTQPTLDHFTSASAGLDSWFESEALALDAKFARAAAMSHSWTDSMGAILFESYYDLDPWARFEITIENFSNETMFINTAFTLGPLDPRDVDTEYLSSLSVTALDGTSANNSDGSATVRSGGTGALAYTLLGGLDSAGFGDGMSIAGAEAGSLSTVLAAGDSIGASTPAMHVGLGPAGAADPDAYWGTFIIGFQLAISPGDSAVVSGRVQLIPAPATATLAAAGAFAAVRRRRR